MYFFDTYAIIEIINGNNNYERFENELITTSALNIGELYYSLLREHGKKTAEYWTRRFNYDLIEIDVDSVIKAAKFRFVNKRKKFSYIDCIGYMLALNKNIKFLTGDKGFKDMENVEFVK